jgi:hypothetical protein
MVKSCPGALSSDKAISPSIQDEISTPPETNRERFQWVGLILEMLQILRVLRPSQIDCILDSLPKGLEYTYDRLLQQVDPSDIPEACLAWKWLSLAKKTLLYRGGY